MAGRVTPLGGSVDESSPARSKRGSGNAGGRAAAQAHRTHTASTRTAASGCDGHGDGVDEHGQQPSGRPDGAPDHSNRKSDGGGGITWRAFRGSTSSTPSNKGKGGDGSSNRKGNRFGRKKKVLPCEGGFGGGEAHEGEAVTDPLVPAGQEPFSTEMTTTTMDAPTAGGHESTAGNGGVQDLG